MKILILGRRDDGRAGFDSAEKFERVISDNQLDGVATAAYEELTFDMSPGKVIITDEKNNRDLKEYDLVYFTGWFKDYNDHVFAVATYLKHHGVQFFNSEAIKNRSKGKINQFVKLGIAHLPFPVSYFGSHEYLVRESRNGRFSFPLIIKSPLGFKGRDNHLVSSHDELEQALAENPEVPFIAQSYVENEGDLRVLVFDGRVPFAIGRSSQGESHLNNTSQGGSAVMIETKSLPQQVVEDSIAACALFNREFAGVDIVQDTQGNHYFMEVTNLPQIATGAFVDEKVDALVKALNLDKNNVA